MHWNFANSILYAGSICTTIGELRLRSGNKPLFDRLWTHLHHYNCRSHFDNAVCTRWHSAHASLTSRHGPTAHRLHEISLVSVQTCTPPPHTVEICVVLHQERASYSYCTSQPMDEIKAIEKEERANLYVFDLPVAVAIGLVILWMFFCCLILHLAAPEWGLIETFYFFFISLRCVLLSLECTEVHTNCSTIGLGDIIPSDSTVLIWMFIPIIVGLSLVSMVINLIQLHLFKTYEAGRSRVIGDDASKTSSVDEYTIANVQTILSQPGRRSQQGLYTPTKQFSTLGIIQPNYSQMPHIYDEDDNYSYEIHPAGTIENKAYLPDASEV